MSLKFKRNYPIILLLIAILSLLAFAIGDQTIVAYTVRAEDLQIEQAATTLSGFTKVVAELIGLPSTQTTKEFDFVEVFTG